MNFTRRNLFKTILVSGWVALLGRTALAAPDRQAHDTTNALIVEDSTGRPILF